MPAVHATIGVLGFDKENGGFWLMHSAPKFPDSRANSSYGGIYPGQTLHAQAFVCISLNATVLDSIAGLLQITDLFIYSPRELPEALARAYPALVQLLARAKSPDAPLLPAAFQQNLTFSSAGLPAADIGWKIVQEEALFQHMLYVAA